MSTTSRFQTLRILADACCGLAALPLFLSALTFMFCLLNAYRGDEVLALLLLVISALMSATLYSFGALTRLLIALEANSRAAAVYLAKLAKNHE